MKRLEILGFVGLVVLLLLSMVTVYFMYQQYQLTLAKDVALKKEIAGDQAAIEVLKAELGRKEDAYASLEQEVQKLEQVENLKIINYSPFAMPEHRVRGDSVMYARNLWDVYFGKLKNGDLELVHSLSKKDRLVDYQFTSGGIYILVYEVGGIDQKAGTAKVDILFSRLTNRAFKRTKQLNARKTDDSTYTYNGMEIAQGEKYLVIKEEVDGVENFRIFDLKDFVEVSKINVLTEALMKGGLEFAWVGFAGESKLLYQVIHGNDTELVLYDLQTDRKGSLELRGFRGSYYHYATGSGLAFGRNTSTGDLTTISFSEESFFSTDSEQSAE